MGTRIVLSATSGKQTLGFVTLGSEFPVGLTLFVPEHVKLSRLRDQLFVVTSFEYLSCLSFAAVGIWNHPN